MINGLRSVSRWMCALVVACGVLGIPGSAQQQITVTSVTPTTTQNLPMIPRGNTSWDGYWNGAMSTIDTGLDQLQRHYQGTWSSTVTYMKGQEVTVTVSGTATLYVSLTNNNLGNSPPATSSLWQAMLSSSTGTTGAAFTGGPVTSAIILPANPTTALQAATKGYVDLETTRAQAAEATNATALSGSANDSTARASVATEATRALAAEATKQNNLNCTITGSGSSQVTSCPGTFAIPKIQGPGGIALVAAGDSRMAGSAVVTSAAPANCTATAAPYCATGAAAQDILSQLALQSQFAGRVSYFYNGARGGSTCSTMTTDYTGQAAGAVGGYVNAWKPGGSSAPTATTSYLFILDGINDVLTGHTTVQAFTACMGAYLQTATADGFTPVLLTSYFGQGSSAANIYTHNAINRWYKSQDGRTINGKTITVLDLASQFPPSQISFDYLDVPLFTSKVTSYSIATCGTNCSQITLNLSAASNGVFGSYNAEIGGFATSTQLNYQYLPFSPNYISGAGTNTLVYQLPVPLAATGTVTETGYIWAFPTLNTASTNASGLHLGPTANVKAARFLNDAFGVAGLGTRSSRSPESLDRLSPESGHVIVDGTLCVNNDLYSTYSNVCAALLSNPGAVMFVQSPQNSNAAAGGFYAGGTTIYLGGSSTYLRTTNNQVILQGATYTGPSGSIGSLSPVAAGSNYAVGDTGTVAACSGLTYTVQAISTTGGVVALTSNGTTTTGCTTISAGSTTATTGSGTGLTVNGFTSNSQTFQANFPGSKFVGGSLFACAVSGTCGSVDTTGWLGSYFLTAGGGVKLGGNSDFIENTGTAGASQGWWKSSSGATITTGAGYGTTVSTYLIQGTLYSAAGTPLPTCNSSTNKGGEAVVSDATSPTYLGNYTSGGAVTAPVLCNGTAWVTY